MRLITARVAPFRIGCYVCDSSTYGESSELRGIGDMSGTPHCIRSFLSLYVRRVALVRLVPDSVGAKRSGVLLLFPLGSTVLSSVADRDRTGAVIEWPAPLIPSTDTRGRARTEARQGCLCSWLAANRRDE